MKRTILFFSLSMVVLVSLAQKNPYTGYKFLPDTRLIQDYGFCVAMPENMVEDYRSEKYLFGSDDNKKCFYNSISKEYLIISYTEWDGKKRRKNFCQRKEEWAMK